MRECFFKYNKTCSVRNAFCINDKLPIDKQRTNRHINVFTFLCFAMISSIQNKETKYIFYINHLIPNPYFIGVLSYIPIKRYLKLQTKILE